MINTEIFTSTNTAQRLLNDYDSDSLSHAYLIIGDKGSGKFTLATAFAQLILCEDPQDGKPCGRCACCSYFESFDSHPNVTVLTTGNKASIGVKEIREMSENVFTAPYMGSKKIYIIKEAEKLTPQAQNAMLKLIEEPPEYAVFFLLASTRYSMLSTVISRCRLLNMTPYPKHVLEGIIRDKAPETDSATASALISRAQGNPGRLLSSISKDDSIRTQVVTSVEALLTQNMEAVLDSVNFIDSRESAISFVFTLNEIMRDVSVYKLEENASHIINTDLEELIARVAQSTSLKKIVQFLDEIRDTHKMLTGNVTYQLCVKSLLLKW